MAIPTRAELEALVRERIASDPDFRAALLADPRGAVSDLVGVTVPELVEVKVHQESLTDIHLVVAAPVVDDGQIHEDDLELVAGGACWTNDCTPGP